MSRCVLFALLVAAACAPVNPLGTGPNRIVLLSYATQPTSADSAAVFDATGGLVTIYPLINSMTVRSPLPVERFSALAPTPGRITDFNALQCKYQLDLELTVAPTFDAADSTGLLTAGFQDFYISRRHDLVDITLTPANFAGINRYHSSNVISAQMYFDCITLSGLARGAEGSGK